MFIERSAAKIRLVRMLFVLLAVLPCAGLAGWAVYRRSATFRDGLAREVEQLLGVAVAIDDVRHLRPGGLRCGRVRFRSADQAVELIVRDVEVESSTDELRLRLPELVCSPEGAGLLAGIARAWLTEPMRFTRNWVIEIGGLAWSVGDQPAAARRRSREVRVECVAAGGSRAVRIVRSAGPGEAADEIRVVVGDPSHSEAGMAELHAAVGDPLPWSIVRPLVGSGAAGRLSFGADAVISGSCTAIASAGGWSGQGSGRIDMIDIGSIGGMYRLAGTATLDIERMEWSDDRLVRLEAAAVAGRGRVDQALLETLVGVGGCRRGPAHRSLSGETLRPFDEVDCRLVVDGAGMRVRAAPGREGALIRWQGLSLVDEPAAIVPLDRLAWLISPVPGPSIPAVPGAAWLMTVMPQADSRPLPTDGRPPPSGRTAGQRSDF